MNLVNELAEETIDNLTKTFLETLCNREFGKSLSFEGLTTHYDRYGYNYAYSLVSTQRLTSEERKSLEEQKEQYLKVKTD